MIKLATAPIAILLLALAGCQSLTASDQADAPDQADASDQTGAPDQADAPDQTDAPDQADASNSLASASAASATLAPSQYPAVYQAAIDVLRDWGFVIARQNYRFGLVRSEPLDIERIAVRGPDAPVLEHRFAQASIQHQRRIVTVQLKPQKTMTPRHPGEPAPEPFASPFELTIEVTIQQRQVPRRQLVLGAKGANILGAMAASDDPWKTSRPDPTDPFWRDLTRDAVMQRMLLEQIVERSRQR